MVQVQKFRAKIRLSKVIYYLEPMQFVPVPARQHRETEALVLFYMRWWFLSYDLWLLCYLRTLQYLFEEFI